MYNIWKYSLLILIITNPFLSQLIGQTPIKNLVTENIKAAQEANTIEEKLRYHFKAITLAQKLETKDFEQQINSVKKLFPECDSDLCSYWINRIKGFEASTKRDFETSKKYYLTSLELARTLNDNNLIALINQDIGNHFQEIDDSKASLPYFQEALKIYEAAKKKEEIALILNSLGISYDLMFKREKAIECYDRIISMQSEVSEDIYSRATYNKAIVLETYGRYTEALATYLESINYLIKEKNEKELALTYEQIARVHTELNDFESAIHYSKLAGKIWMKFDDKYRLVGFYTDYARIYKLMNQLDSALLYINQGYQLSVEVGDRFFQCVNTIEMGNILILKALKKSHDRYEDDVEFLVRNENMVIDTQLLEKAFDAYHISYDYGKNNKSGSVYTTGLWGMARVHFFKKEYIEAANYFREADILDKTNNIRGLIASKRYLNAVEAKLGNYESAYNHLLDYSILKDSFYNTQKVQETVKLQADFEFEKEREKTTLLHQEELNREALIRKFLIIGSVMLCLFLFILYRNYLEKQRINTQLEQLNQTKDRLFAIIGHDLRKPVVAFRGVSKTINYLIKKGDQDRLQKLGTAIEKDGFALQKLTDNLLSWALTQRDVLPYRPQTLNLSEMAEEINSIFENVATKKNIELSQTIPKDLKIYADFNAMMTVMTNLVDNALKYTSEGGRIELTAMEKDGFVQFQVKDTGIGIAAAQLSDIFLLKKDKSQKGTAGEKGTGLGLHLVSELVKMNKGEIKVESEVGKGTIFRVLIPKEGQIAA